MVSILTSALTVFLLVSAAYADPITFTFDGKVTTGAPGNQIYPGVNVGDRVSGQFTIDNISTLSSDSGPTFRSYFQSTPMSLSVGVWDISVGLPSQGLQMQFFPDRDVVSLVGPYEFTTPTSSGLGSGFLSVDFQFSPGTIPDMGPDGMPQWTNAVSAQMGWTSPLGGIIADIDPDSVTRVPLPGTLLLLGSGLAGMLAWKLRKLRFQ